MKYFKGEEIIMNKTKKCIAAIMVMVILIGLVPARQEVQAANNTEDIGIYYIAKGETIVFKIKSYSGKVSVVSSTGSKVKVSGKKVYVTGVKNGGATIKVGKKKLSFNVFVGGNGVDKKVNYSEYNSNLVYKNKKYKNFIDLNRYQVKKKKPILFNYLTDPAENKEIKKTNRGIGLGQKIYKVQDKYPSWCDFGGWTTEDGKSATCAQCALYYDKKSDCVFAKWFIDLDEDDLIDEIRWVCWKNKSEVYTI